MSQQPPDNSESQQPDASSRQQADSSIPQNVVQGNQNRSVQGNDNQAVLGDGNTVNQEQKTLITITQNFSSNQQTTTSVRNPARQKNERLLLDRVKHEVTGRLRDSLHNAMLINLGKETKPQQVKRSRDPDIKIGLKPAVPLPDTITILEVFDSQEILGRLLILGAPGAGKTTTQLELAQDLVQRAQENPDYPVPVLFNLFSWKDDRQSISDWLVTELKSKHGFSEKFGQKWLENHRLLPLLDGLDELKPQRQELCVCAINQFLASENRPLYVVICSRSEEYINYSTRLQLDGAIYLQSLTNNQIYDYLTSINYIELWSTISSDLHLLELVEIPLLLSITVLVSQDLVIKEWQHFTSIADRTHYLLDAYVRQMLTREIECKAYFNNKFPNKKQTLIWLVWLAQQMQKESETELMIEEMQPTWLISKYQEISYMLILGLIFGLIFGLILLLYYWLDFSFHFWLYFGLYFLLILVSRSKRIKLREKIVFSKNKKFRLISGLISGLFGLIWGLTFKNIFGLIWGFIWGFILGLFMWLYCIISGQPDPAIENKKIPNQGIRKSALNAVFVGLIWGLIWGLKYGLTHRPILGLIGLKYDLIYGLIHGLIGGLLFSGIPVIKHFTLRLILYRNGYIPWNYARFLNYSTERLFLQRVGGRYRFIHKLVQDHFAEMDLKRN